VSTPTEILGTLLCETDQRHVLAAYVHRFTGEHRPAWANEPMPNGQPYPLQFKDDLDWLAHSYFAIRRDGRLSARAEYCESYPTWPNNPELRLRGTPEPAEAAACQSEE
jgi:hypothetical protein